MPEKTCHFRNAESVTEHQTYTCSTAQRFVFYDNTGTPEYRQHTVTNEMEYRGASAPTQAANHTYDDNGNLTDDGTYEYEWDALNRLIKVLKKDDPDFTVGEYTFSGWQVIEESVVAQGCRDKAADSGG